MVFRLHAAQHVLIFYKFIVKLMSRLIGYVNK